MESEDFADPTSQIDGRDSPTAGVSSGRGDSDEDGLDAKTVPPRLGAQGADSSAPMVGASFDDYELLDEIARGGMGIVYRARQRSLGRIVALKMIRPEQFADEDEVRRFRDEANVVAKLRHPAIVAIHDLGVDAGRHFFTMDLIEGESLAGRLARGPLQCREAANLVRIVAGAVAHAHSRQIVHRDLKPANILLDENGAPHVTDFGLALRRPEGVEATPGETLPGGAIVGTPGFMPPEQAAGRPYVVGPTLDVYALGAVLYATLTGRAPFHAATALETLVQVLETNPASPCVVNRAVPRDLDAIVMKCLRKSPRDRYANAQEVADDLARFLADQPVHARRGQRLYASFQWLRRNLILASVSSTAALLLASLTLLLAWAYRAEVLRRMELERELEDVRRAPGAFRAFPAPRSLAR